MFYTHMPEGWIRTITCALEIGAAAMVAYVAGRIAGLSEVPSLLLQLGVLRLKICYALFKRRVLLLKCGILLRRQANTLPQDSGRSVLGDQLLDRVEDSQIRHMNPNARIQRRERLASVRWNELLGHMSDLLAQTCLLCSVCSLAHGVAISDRRRQLLNEPPAREALYAQVLLCGSSRLLVPINV